MQKNIKILNSFITGAIIAVVFIILITIIAEFSPDTKFFLKNTFTHHWIGKSVLSLIIFIAASLIFWIISAKTDIKKICANIRILIFSVAAGSLAILLFFVYETFYK